MHTHKVLLQISINPECIPLLGPTPDIFPFYFKSVSIPNASHFFANQEPPNHFTPFSSNINQSKTHPTFLPFKTTLQHFTPLNTYQFQINKHQIFLQIRTHPNIFSLLLQICINPKCTQLFCNKDPPPNFSLLLQINQSQVHPTFL